MRTTIFILAFFTLALLSAQNDRWVINEAQNGVIWKVAEDQRLPHGDNIEMSGRKVSMVIDYQVDENRMVRVQRRMIYPQMRPFIKDTDPAWWATYRNYLRRNYEDEEVLPKLYVGNRQVSYGPVKEIEINGILTIKHQSDSGLSITRKFFPATNAHRAYEYISFANERTDTLRNIKVGRTFSLESQNGNDGTFYTTHRSEVKADFYIFPPGHEYTVYISMYAGRNAPPPPLPPGKKYKTQVLENRITVVDGLQQNLILETPEPIYNTMFSLAKIRGAESIFDSKIGLVHSPGGERYYTGFWANDQAEYINPFFPYLGYELGNEAALNMWRVYQKAIPKGDGNIRYSFEMAGDAPVNPLDRGDAAMIAYGLSHYLLALGDADIAKELLPLLTWCLDYNHSKLNENGVVASESDEMEGRIETGDANLATSSLYYAALETSIDLYAELGFEKKILKSWAKRRKDLGRAIEQFFGREVEGLHTYRYYEGHENLRHWVCLPLIAGIDERKEGTIDALFERLWTDNGVHVEKNAADPKISEIFWDRGTLYALRGTLMAGATERTHEKLLAFSRKRLLGDRVPYVVEAYPEGNMAHLSAENALYCRIFTEGMFGIMPTGFRSFRLAPRMPKEWDKMALRNVKAFGQDEGFDVEILRNDGGFDFKVAVFATEGREVLRSGTIGSGESVEIELD